MIVFFKKSPYETTAGSPEKLGTQIVAEGVNFALYSAHAHRVELLLFENLGNPEPSAVIRLHPGQNRTGDIWHILVKGVGAGIGYMYRIDGPQTTPHSFHPHKLLLDPYAQALDRRFYSRVAAVGEGDNLSASLRAVVIDEKSERENFDWRGQNEKSIEENFDFNKHPENLVIYELHPKGFTASRNCDATQKSPLARIREKLSHLKELGVNAIELMPIQAFDDDLAGRRNETGQKITNYWGYSPLGYFALQESYGSRKELRELVRAAHSQNIAVIMDVVYNHTTEADNRGPILSWRGIDNSNYYLLYPEDQQFYLNYSGCGNTLSANSEVSQKMIVDSLEYWVKEFRIDGFRFDLGGCFYYNEDGYFMSLPPVIDRINKSEILKGKILSTEPWDASGLNMLGNFGGERWLEWNNRFRDLTRKLVRGERQVLDNWEEVFWGQTPEFLPDKSPNSSVNFVTVHDGFTLLDLVSYTTKRNQANGFNNTDGSNENYSDNNGVEGPTNLVPVIENRWRQMRNFWTLMMLSRGAVILNMGDEGARTQWGNNNAFCQDNELSYFNWTRLERENFLTEYLKKMIKLRKEWRIGERLLGAKWTVEDLGKNTGIVMKTELAGVEKEIWGNEGEKREWAEAHELVIVYNPSWDPAWMPIEEIEKLNKNEGNIDVEGEKEMREENKNNDEAVKKESNDEEVKNNEAVKKENNDEAVKKENNDEAVKKENEITRKNKKWRQIIDTNNLPPFDFVWFDLAGEIEPTDNLFLAPRTMKVLVR